MVHNTDFLVIFLLELILYWADTKIFISNCTCSVYKAAEFSCCLSTSGQTSARIPVQRSATEKYHHRKRGNLSNINITAVVN